MIKTYASIFQLVVILLFYSPINAQDNRALAKEGTAPFSKIDFKAENIFVSLVGKKYEWLMLDTLEVADLVNQFQDNFDGKWRQRFSEDIVEYLNKLDVYPKERESVTLKNEVGEVMVMVVTFDETKRKQAKEHFESIYDRDIDNHHILSRQEAIDDLNQLQGLIQDKYSYAFFNDVKAAEEIQAIKAGLANQISTYDLALRIGRFLNLFGDGHSRIHNVNFKEGGVLPFSVSSLNGKVVCTKEGKLLDTNYPYLHSINGIAVAKLLATSNEYFTANGSPQYQERMQVSRLSRIGEILKINGSTEKKLAVILESDNGKTITIQRDMIPYVSRKNMSQDQLAEFLEKRKNYDPFEVNHYDKISYLKIKSMDALRGDHKKEWPLDQIKKSEGLIIDVRNNGGGVRDILMQLAPHLISKEQGFVVGNVARLRTNKPSDNHDLSDRYLYQINDEHFEEADKIRLTNWTNDFSQSISLSDSLYSSIYYLYIKGHKKAKLSHVPTVVLMNEGCFSATDIFLSTLKEIDGVTLIGTTSGGGSGRSKRYKLTNSLIELRLSSIVSFQPNGDLYDGIGVQPDIIVKQSGMSDELKETDSQLEFALEFLKGSMK